MHFVYILKCSDETFYTGCTSNLNNRLSRHNKGQVHYTKDKLPFELITYIAFSGKHKAYQFEKYLKSGSGIAFRNKRLV
jgi:putative endonuclease